MCVTLNFITLNLIVDGFQATLLVENPKKENVITYDKLREEVSYVIYMYMYIMFTCHVVTLSLCIRLYVIAT